MQDNKQVAAYGPDYWQNDGGQAWLDNIDATETLIAPLGTALLRRAAPQSGEIVLDVGCGGGQTTQALALAVASEGQAVGVDVSPAISDLARRRGTALRNLEFKVGNAETAPLGQEVYDLIVSRFGVMFFTDPVAAFRNLRMALKPTGRLVFMCWQPLAVNPWMADPAAAANEIVPPAQPPDPQAPGPFSLGEPVRIEDILTSSGFAKPTIESVSHEMVYAGIDGALDYITKMGPVGRLVRETDSETAGKIRTAVAAVLQRYRTGDSVRMPANTWIVTASL